MSEYEPPQITKVPLPPVVAMPGNPVVVLPDHELVERFIDAYVGWVVGFTMLDGTLRDVLIVGHDDDDENGLPVIRCRPWVDDDIPDEEAEPVPWEQVVRIEVY